MGFLEIPCVILTSGGKVVMFRMKVASTHEVIEKLQEYEKENGIGAITGISTYCNDDRENEYCFEIANDSESNRVLTKDGKYKITKIEISSVEDDTLFPSRYNNESENAWIDRVSE